MPESTFFPLPREQLGGAIVVNVFAILSAVALVAFGLRILWLATLNFLDRPVVESREYIFFRTQLGYYAGCLLLGNMFNSLAGLLGLRTLGDGGTFQDEYCAGQAFLMQFGNLATAYFTTAIGVHTFNSLVLHKRQAAGVYTSALVFGWIMAGILAALPFFLPKPNGPIYGISGMSCGIASQYIKTQFLLHLLPIFLTAIISAILFALVFLVLRGTLVIRGGFKFRLNPGERWKVHLNGAYERFVAGIAKSMIWYPIAYIVLLIPYSVTRLFGLSGFPIPFQALVFAFTCWFLLGIVNVLLLYNTLRVLSPAFDGRSSGKDPESPAEKSPSKQDMTSQKSEKPTFQFPTFYPISPATETTSSGFGSERNLISYPERTASISSYYSYPTGTFVTGEAKPVQVAPDPVFRGLSPPFLKELSFDSPTDTFVSLPPPPRRSRTPPTSREPTADTLRASKKLVVVPPQTGTVSAEPIQSGLAPSLKRETSVRLRTPSNNSTASDLDIASWLAKQRPDGSMPHGLKNQPLLSAVIPSPSFSQPTSSGPVPGKPETGSRPLLQMVGDSETVRSPGASPIAQPASARYNFI